MKLTAADSDNISINRRKNNKIGEYRQTRAINRCSISMIAGKLTVKEF